MYYLDIAVIIVFAALYHKAAEIENASTLVWTSLSIGVSLLTQLFNFGLAGLIICQVLLFFAIAAVRAIPKNHTD